MVSFEHESNLVFLDIGALVAGVDTVLPSSK